MAHAKAVKAPASFRRDFAPTNGPAHSQAVGGPSLDPIRGPRTPASPPGVAPTDLAHPNIATPLPPRPPIPPPTAPSSSRKKRQPNGSSNHIPNAQTGSESTPLNDEDGDYESATSSEDDSAPSPGRPPSPTLSRALPVASRARGGVLPPPPPPWAFGRGRGPGIRPQPAQPWPPSQASSFSMQHQFAVSGLEASLAYSESGTSNDSTGAEREELWARVTNQRDRVRRLRADIMKKRKEVQALRRQKDDTDNAFMQVIRPQLHSMARVVAISAEVISQRFGAMQTIRNDYYAAEFAYEAIEADLGREEYELELLEDDLYHLLNDNARASHRDSSSSPSEEDHSKETDVSEFQYSLLGISGVREEDVHPLYKELMDAAGDRELHKEHHDELRQHRDKILYDIEMSIHRARVRANRDQTLSPQELRSLKSSLAHIPTDINEFRVKFGVPVEKEDLDFLRDFSREEQEVKKKLDEMTRRVEHLRNLCMVEGVIPKNGSYNEQFTIFSTGDRRSLLPEGNMAIEPHPRHTESGNLAHPRFPILLSNPSHVLELLSPGAALEQAMRLPRENPENGKKVALYMKELGISNLMKKSEGKPDYINQWLIHRLRTCPMEAELMYAISATLFKISNVRRWQEDVLYYWRKDEAARRSPHDFHGPRTPRDELGMDDGSELYVNSVIETSTRAKSEIIGPQHHRRHSGGVSTKSSP